MIIPLADYLLIEPLEGETVSPAGIFIPDASKEKPQQGKVVVLGPLVSEELKPDLVVMYKRWGGVEIKSDGKDYLLVPEEDVLAIVEEDAS